MRTYPLCDESGRQFAFEIENVYISVRTLRRVLSSLQGFDSFFGREKYPQNGEFRLGFECAGHDFVVLEPYGDSSRYWIGPLEGKDGPGSVIIGQIEAALRDHEPAWPVRVFGDILSLNLRGLLRLQQR